MKSNNELVVLLPTYNEENDVEKLVMRWAKQEEVIRKYQLELKIIVVNDGSKDRTKEICENLKKTYKYFELVNHEQNKGLGKAVETGFKYVLGHHPNCLFVCVMDCDNTQNPKYIEDMLRKMSSSKADVIIASRYQKGAAVHGLSWYRRMTSEGARWVYKCVFNVANVRDYTCGFRLYTYDILKKANSTYQERFIEQSGFTCMAEILYKLSCVGARFAEIPFELQYGAKGGKSKMRVIKTIKDSLKLAFELRKIKKDESI